MDGPTFLRAGDVRIAARRLREGAEGEPVYVAIHGFLDHGLGFRPLAERLSAGTLWALDLPGHGASSGLGGRPYLFVDFVADVVRAVGALGAGPFVLVGHSLGAGIAAFAAALVPEAVSRLVLLDGLGPLTEEPAALPDRLARALAEERRLRRTPPRIYADEAQARRTFAAVRSELSDEAVDLLLPASLDRINGGVTWAPDPLVRAPSRLRLTEDHVGAFLGRIACPVLVVRPAEGILARHPDAAARRRAHLEDVRDVDVPGGHHAHIEHADAVAAAVEAFVLRGSSS
ncbi:MAG: alpha/beta fold hydrolase [Deltaproteobacteria bacterium]|nr:MAG: alpha/beta fold hydrolase [Deltaproteobacteria bacterium]